MIRFGELPKDVQHELAKEHCVKLPKVNTSKVARLKDVPESWNRCKAHGWYGLGGTCPYCDE